MPRRRPSVRPFFALFAAACLGACGAGDEGGASGAGDGAGLSSDLPLDTTHAAMQVSGFEGPEAVRWDPEQEVWFVSNFGAGSGEDQRDGDGFISRVGPDGAIEALRFAVGTDETPFHMGRGMILKGDTLFVADVDGVHGFHRATGESLTFIDFTAHQPGFLNDLALDPEGTVHVTDTGAGRVYRIVDGEAVVAVEDTLTGPPNGITWDPRSERFVLAPWGGGTTLRAWDPETGELTAVAELVGGDFDGIELVDSRYVIASQRDSSIHAVENGRVTRLIRLPGEPADIAVNGEGRLAVPYVALGRVDFWDLRF